MSHFCFGENILETSLSASDTLENALDHLRSLLGYECVIDTYPDSAFVTEVKCIKCRAGIIINKPMAEIYSDESYCSNCSKSNPR